MNEKLGFDCRYWGDELAQLSDKRFRADFMLDTEIRMPLSVDRCIWPSIFDTNADLWEEPQDWRLVPHQKLGIQPIPVSGFIGSGPFWQNLEELHAMIERHQVDMSKAKVVQVIRCVAGYGEELLSPGFNPIGYDVCDEMPVSGLLNCGYTPQERAALHQQFGHHINEHHLFRGWEVARDFARLTNSRVPEHAPFDPCLLAWHGA